jgi:hypothetical protein
MKLFVAAIILALGASAHAQSKVVLTWANSNTGIAKCSTILTSPSACDGTQVVGETVNGISTPISSTVDPYATSYTISPLPLDGVHTYYVLQNFLDFSGVAQTTATATTTATVKRFQAPSAPSNLQAIQQ